MKRLHIFILLLLTAGYSHAAELISVVNLRCEYLTNPLGIDMQHPRLSWELTSDGKNKKQTARQILVATDPSLLFPGKADVWDSGKIRDSRTNQIPMNGQLNACTLYYWQVAVWDEHDKQSAWSSAAHFLTAPLSAGDWRAQWIGDYEDPIDPTKQLYRPTGNSKRIGKRRDDSFGLLLL